MNAALRPGEAVLALPWPPTDTDVLGAVLRFEAAVRHAIAADFAAVFGPASTGGPQLRGAPIGRAPRRARRRRAETPAPVPDIRPAMPATPATAFVPPPGPPPRPDPVPVPAPAPPVPPAPEGPLPLPTYGDGYSPKEVSALLGLARIDNAVREGNARFAGTFDVHRRRQDGECFPVPPGSRPTDGCEPVERHQRLRNGQKFILPLKRTMLDEKGARE